MGFLAELWVATTSAPVEEEGPAWGSEDETQQT